MNHFLALDIVSRIAVFAMAKSLSEPEVEAAFDLISEAMGEVYNETEVKEMTDRYKESVIKIKSAYK